MADTFSLEKRSKIMKQIKGKDTTPELKVRSYLHHRGLRFRIHAADLPGKPDLVIKKYKVAIFINGCFWHQHDEASCTRSSVPKSNREYWLPKLQKTVVRDNENKEKLLKAGWHVIIIWECKITETELNDVFHKIELYKNKVI